MADILVVAGGFPSNLYPSVELARRLHAAGHRVSLAGPVHARALAEHCQLEFLPLEPSRYREFLDEDGEAGVLERLASVQRRRERAIQSMAVEGFARAVRDLRPDLVLIDGEMHEHIIAASAAGVPIALVNLFVSIWRRPGLPPPHHLVRPGVGWKGTRVGIALLWLALRWRKRCEAWARWIHHLGCDRLSILRRLADETGFDLSRETDAGQWLKPFTYRRFPVLSLHALELELPHRPPERVRYLGPMVLEARVDRQMPEPERARLDAVFERRGDGRKLIYAGFGSEASTDLRLLKRLAGVVAERADWDVLISLSDRIAREELEPLPERVHAFPWVPQLEVLRHADVAVTHGGINTIDECVLARVPMLVYCGFETDMAGNAARVVHHGIGIAADRDRDDTSDIREQLDRLLSAPSFAANLERLGKGLAAYADDRVAERAVDALLESGR